MSCPTSICNETCPAAISTINIVTNQLVLGDAAMTPVHQRVYPAGSIITLPNNDAPVAGTFGIYRNGQLLTPSTDYTLSDDTITLVVAPEDGDIYLAGYLAERA